MAGTSKANAICGLQVGRRIRVSLDGGGLLVKPEVAQAQLSQHEERHEEAGHGGDVESAGNEGATLHVTTDERAHPEAPKARRFHGSVVLNPVRLGRDAAEIANEIVQHLMKQPGASVEVTIEIQAEITSPGRSSRTVNENCRTLKFQNFDFEES